MSKKEKVIKVPNKVSDQELVKLIDEYSEKGYRVTVDSKNQKNGYIELVLK